MSTPFNNALTQLAALQVAGVDQHYAIDQLPPTLERAQLPALLVLPLDNNDDRLFQRVGGGFEALAFANGTRSIRYTVTHLLLIAPLAGGAGLRAHLPGLITTIDAYFDALKDDVRLNDTLLEPTQVDVDPGIYTYGEARYIGCALRHLWHIQL